MSSLVRECLFLSPGESIQIARQDRTHFVITRRLPPIDPQKQLYGIQLETAIDITEIESSWVDMFGKTCAEQREKLHPRETLTGANHKGQQVAASRPPAFIEDDLKGVPPVAPE